MLYIPRQPLPSPTDLPQPHPDLSWSRAISVDELLYLSGDYNYSWLHGRHGQSTLVSVTLKRLLIELPDTQFVRIHRSYVINRQFVDRIETQRIGNHWLFLITGHSLPVSRRRWVAVRRQLGAAQIHRSALMHALP